MGGSAGGASVSEDALELLELEDFRWWRFRLREKRIECRYTHKNARLPARKTARTTPTTMPMVTFIS